MPITQKEFQAICQRLKKNDSTLTYLDLSGSHGAKGIIGDQEAKTLAEALQHNTNLTRLDLGSNNIGTVGAEAIARILQNNTNLRELYLRNNRIGTVGAQTFAHVLQHNTTLIRLDLGNNYIDTAGAQAFAHILQSNTSLTQLGLGSNNIGTAGAQAFAHILQSNTTLTQLDLRNNNIDTASVQAEKNIVACLHRNQQTARQQAATALDLEQAQRKLKEKAELAVHLHIFQKHGLPPKEWAFQQFLSASKRLFKEKKLPTPTCFISYAWEDDSTPAGKAANEQMQRWLGRFASDLRRLELTVFFDLDNMHGDLRAAMRDNIAQSDYFLLIGTSRLKQRIEAGLTPTLKDYLENSRLSELEGGLQKLKNNAPDKAAYDPKNNATFEFIHIWARAQRKPEALIPLQYQGTFAEAIPLTIGKALVRDAHGIQDNDEKYYSLLADLSAPLGIIPAVYQLRSKERQTCLKEYQPLLEGFKNKLKVIDLELKQAQTEVQTKQAALNLTPAYSQHGLFGGIVSSQPSSSTSTTPATTPPAPRLP